MTSQELSYISNQFILASASTFRAELLRRLQIPFRQIAADIDESRRPGEAPEHMVRRLAAEKAGVIASNHPGAIIIASDQCAVLDEQVLGKPGTIENARQQLNAMSGRSVTFLTSLHVLNQTNKQHAECIDETRVEFLSLSDHIINRYLEHENVLQCAGSFRSEGLGISLFSAIHNTDPTALIGLPMISLCHLLRQLGIEPLDVASIP